MIYRKKPRSNAARLHALQRAAYYVKHKAAGQLPLSSEMVSRIKQMHQTYHQRLRERNHAQERTVNRNRDRAAARDRMRGTVGAYTSIFRTWTNQGWVPETEYEYFGLRASSSLETPRTQDELLPWVTLIIEGERNRLSDNCEAMTLPSVNMLEDDFEAYEEAIDAFNEANVKYRDVQKAFVEYISEVDAFIAELWSLLEHLYRELPKPARRSVLRHYGVVYVSSAGVEIQQDGDFTNTDFDGDPTGPSAPDFDETFNTDAGGSMSEPQVLDATATDRNDGQAEASPDAA